MANGDFFALAKSWQHYFVTNQQTPITQVDYEAVDALLANGASYGLDYTLTTLPKEISFEQSVFQKLSGQLSRGTFYALVRRQWQTQICDQHIDFALYPWFAYAFREIAKWSGTTRFEQANFSGAITKIALTVVLPFSYRTLPGDDVAQELVIYPDGQCFFEARVRGEHENSPTIDRKITRKLSAMQAEHLYQTFFNHFSAKLTDDVPDGSGRWYVMFINEENQRLQCEGNLGFSNQDTPEFEQQQSTWLREQLQIADLIGFDNQLQRPEILALTFTYTTPTSKAKISLDRLKQQLCFQQTSSDCEIKHTYRGEQISEFIDQLDERHFQPRTIQNPETIIAQLGHQQFDCELRFADETRKFSGKFDAEELPRGYKMFINGIECLLQLEKSGTLFDVAVYEQRKFRTGQHIFLKVEFDDWGKGYHYLTTDPSIQVDDEVIVPVGPSNIHRLARVIKKNYYTAEQAPFPIAKTKAIIRKVTQADEEEFDE
ncbi:MAG: hypothetical protein ACRDD4_09360 [Culicoidibacterales bacterium]